MGIGLLSIVAMTAYLVAGYATATTEKAKSMALADASAKSVGTWYAQILNYDAYTNRAIAANEIMMAQAATMVAWTEYANTLSQNIGTVASIIPAVRPVASLIQETALLSAQAARLGAQIDIPVRSSYSKALYLSQQILHASANPFSAQAMVNEVVWTADPRFFAQIIPSSNISAFSALTKNYAEEDRRNLLSLVERSQDEFTRNRSDESRLYLLPTGGCIPTSFDRAFSKLYKRGGTWLSSDLSSWESADTLSIHTWRRRSRWNRTCGGLGEAVALGWGAVDTNVSGNGEVDDDRANLGANPGAFQNARSSAVRVPGYLGLSNFRELNTYLSANRNLANVRIPVLIRLNDSKHQQITAGKKAVDSAKPRGLGNSTWSLSVAETFFHRPPDTQTNPASREFANLFSPFWSSRLVSPSAADRAVALMMATSKE